MPLRYALTLAATLLALAACGRQPAPKDATETVRIGFAAPLTGPQAHYGVGYRDGVQMAIDDENALRPVIGGRPVRFKLVAEDDQADPKTGTEVAQLLIDAGVVGVIGHFNSGTSIPASRLYADEGIPQIAMSTAPAYTQQGFRTTFRSMTSDTQQGTALGRFVVARLGLRRIAIVDDRTAYGVGLADQFGGALQAAGGDVVQHEFTHDKATDFTALLTAIKASHPDAVFYGGADAQSAPLAIQMRRLGLTVPLISGEMTRTDTFLKLAGRDGDGTIASLAGMPLERMPGSADFRRRFEAKYSGMEIYTPYGYDATRMMIAAMKAAGSVDPKVYLPVLAHLHYRGITARDIAFDAHGDLTNGTITVYKAVNGKWRALETLGG